MQDRRLTLWLALALLFLLACPAFAQRDRDNYVSGITFEVSGVVRIPAGGPPARDITVRLERFSGGVIDQMPTDGSGKFRFSNLPRGYYTIFVSAPGYKPAQQQADLQVLLKAYLTFELLPEKSAATNMTNTVIDARVPADAQAELAKGRAALSEKKLKDALQHLAKAVQLYPNFFEAQYLLGTTYMDDLQLLDAEAALRRALEIKPESAATLISLGEVERREKHYANAEKSLQEALKLDDKAWQGYFTLARVYWEMGDILKAAPPTGHTIQLKPDFAEAHLLAGHILFRVDQPERALTEYEEYLRLAPKGEFAAQAHELIEKIKAKVPQKK
jgi:tetratricopeptide (TPR) repeat protein